MHRAEPRLDAARLTGLANRREFIDRSTAALAAGGAHHTASTPRCERGS
ncbi:MAG TPA: hypothetical protein VFR67_27760 [Pilimelia sp.]|nr:hypothetical protein [Pilimelia sp.]